MTEPGSIKKSNNMTEKHSVGSPDFGKMFSGGWNDVTSTRRNDIVFDGRFKDYGAYFVRSRYKKTLTMAFLLTVVIGIIAISLPVILRALGGNNKDTEEIKNVTVHLIAPPPLNPNTPPPPPPPPKQLINQLRVTPPVVAHQVIDTIPPPTVHQVQETNVGTSNQKGKDTVIAPISTGNAVIGDNSSNQILTIVAQMPQFPGGEAALDAYMQKNIHYPEAEKEAGISGRVYLTFVVEKDGSITNVRLLRGVSGGAALDKEAERVVNAMPKWNVGMQNGHAVRVQFNLPVNFELR